MGSPNQVLTHAARAAGGRARRARRALVRATHGNEQLMINFSSMSNRCTPLAHKELPLRRSAINLS